MIGRHGIFSYQHCWQECSRGSVLGLNYSADPSLAYVHSASSAEGSVSQSSHVLGGWWREIRGYSFEQYTLCNMVLCENHICSYWFLWRVPLHCQTVVSFPGYFGLGMRLANLFSWTISLHQHKEHMYIFIAWLPKVSTIHTAACVHLHQASMMYKFTLATQTMTCSVHVFHSCPHVILVMPHGLLLITSTHLVGGVSVTNQLITTCISGSWKTTNMEHKLSWREYFNLKHTTTELWSNHSCD